jgi:hypothetical protein
LRREKFIEFDRLVGPFEFTEKFRLESPRSFMVVRFTCSSVLASLCLVGLVTAGTAASAASSDATSGFELAVNAGLTQWSAGWAMDRYVTSSAHVTAHEVRQGIDVVVGTFSYLRFGSDRTIPFAAALEHSGSGFRAIRMCYADRSSGMQECADPTTLLRLGAVNEWAENARLADRVFADWLSGHAFASNSFIAWTDPAQPAGR